MLAIFINKFDIFFDRVEADPCYVIAIELFCCDSKARHMCLLNLYGEYKIPFIFYKYKKNAKIFAVMFVIDYGKRRIDE